MSGSPFHGELAPRYRRLRSGLARASPSRAADFGHQALAGMSHPPADVIKRILPELPSKAQGSVLARRMFIYQESLRVISQQATISRFRMLSLAVSSRCFPRCRAALPSRLSVRAALLLPRHVIE